PADHRTTGDGDRTHLGRIRRGRRVFARPADRDLGRTAARRDRSRLRGELPVGVAGRVSVNPLEITDPDIPPVFSGYPSRDRSGWDDFWVEYRRLTDPLVERSSAFHRQCGAPPLPDGEFQYESPYLNLYMYPAELDYQRSRPLGATWQRVD